MAVRQLATRLKETKADGFFFLEQEIGFSPTDDDFSLDVHSYADLSDAAKLHVALHARDRAEKGSAPLVLAALGKSRAEPQRGPHSAQRRDHPRIPATAAGGEPEVRPAPAVADAPELQVRQTAQTPGPVGRLPRRGWGCCALPQRPAQRRPRLCAATLSGSDAGSAHGLLWECGSLRLVLELAMANSRRSQGRNEGTRLPDHAATRRSARTPPWSVAALWPDREIEGGDQLTPPIKAVGPKAAQPPAAVMKPQERGAEFDKYGKDAGSMKPADVKKRAAYPNGLYYGIEVRSEDLPTPAEVAVRAEREGRGEGQAGGDVQEQEVGAVAAERQP